MSISDRTVAIIGIGNIGSRRAANFAAGGQDFLLAGQDREAAGFDGHAMRYALDHGSRQADRYVLDAAPDLLESRDMRYAVDLLLTQGARKFIQNHAEVIFEGR